MRCHYPPGDDDNMSSLDKLVHVGKVKLVVRRPDGSIRAVREVKSNAKVYTTIDIIASLANDPGTLRTVNKLGLGTATEWATADTTLTGEVEPSRTSGLYSHDAVGSFSWNLSWSQTVWSVTHSLGQAGIFDSLTGGNLYLKATFTKVTVMSQDILYVTWLQSLASA